MKKYKCPCCGYYTLEDPPIEIGTFDICPVCYWEDDGLQAAYPDRVGGANGVSLNQARENFKKYGYIEECFKGSGRPPLPDEMPTENE